MDAFESLVADILWRDGFWVQTSVKVPLTKEEKRTIGRHSSPRWEIDVVAYSAKDNIAIAYECKSYFDSYGVNFPEIQVGANTSNYKLFREALTREVVLERLRLTLLEEGRIRSDTTIQLGMIAGNVRAGHEPQILTYFETQGWLFHSRSWLIEHLKKMSQSGYSNDVAAVVAKILLR